MAATCLVGIHIFKLSLSEEEWVMIAALLLLPGLQVTRDFLTSHSEYLLLFDQHFLLPQRKIDILLKQKYERGIHSIIFFLQKRKLYFLLIF